MSQVIVCDGREKAQQKQTPSMGFGFLAIRLPFFLLAPTNLARIIGAWYPTHS